MWADLCAVLTDPQQLAVALKQAQTGAWLPQELQARQATTSHASAGVERQQERLLTASLADLLALPEFARKRREVEQKRASRQMPFPQLNALAQQRIALSTSASAVEAFCAQGPLRDAQGSTTPPSRSNSYWLNCSLIRWS
ncbi:MAG TPA: hypothetical protein VF916_15115 [Ktedonobacterales bacterium]